VILDYSMAW